jgi:hypothetical protein
MPLSTQAAKRRCSYLEIEKNPLESSQREDGSSSVSGSSLSLAGSMKIESLADTVKIERDDLNEIISALERTT